MADMQEVKQSVDQKIVNIQTTIAEQVAAQLTESLQSTVNKAVDEKLGEIKANVDRDLRGLKADIQGLRERVDNRNVREARDEEHSLQIVIRELPEGDNESVVDKINAVIREGIKLPEVKVTSAERKKSFKRGQPGLVIAQYASRNDKQLIMENKARLKDSRQHKDIMINHSKSREQRLQEANLRTIVNALGQGQLALRGNHVIRQDQARDQDREHQGGRQDERGGRGGRRGRGGRGGRGGYRGGQEAVVNQVNQE